jgi:predicted TIM-barrel fold metal-dependent hydrolase
MSGSAVGISFIEKSQPQKVIIDVHHHVCPDVFMERVTNVTYVRDPSLPPVGKGAMFMDGKMPYHSVDGSLEFMKKAGITFALTSITAEERTYHLPIEEEIKYLKACNEYQMDMVNTHPTKFGAFLSFPLSSAEHGVAGIQEIRKTYGDKFDGLLLPAEMKGTFLGDAHYVPILEELNKERTVVFTHPMTKENMGGMMSTFSQACVEFMFQTTRTITTLLVSGAFSKYPNIKWIFPHMGGTFPYIAHRLELYHQIENIFDKLWEHKNVYFDTAGSFSEAQWNSGIKPEQLLAGSDAPYQNFLSLGQSKWLSEQNIDLVRNKDNVCFKNAFTLFPRLEKLFAEKLNN